MLDKSFDAAASEQRQYAQWEADGRFAAHPESNKRPFTIMMPPPNVTGTLHAGHALDNTLQDVLVRWRRMEGRDALWQPGTDHAGIATQMVVERQLAKDGIDRKQIGRDAFIERVWQWKAQSGDTITRQLRRLGASPDWSRERFTMDEGLSEAVRTVFVRLFREGLIYRDRRLVNWDPEFGSALSDIEVENRETRGSMWYLRYPLADAAGRPTDETITVATTRPETMLGDSAVAVHPEDDRYAALIGRHVVLPLTGRLIPIVADAYSDPEKGTGAVKITPAHDFNDFEVGRRHDLPMPTILDAQAKLTIAEIESDLVEIDGLSSRDFVTGIDGQPREAARRAIVAELERLGWLERVEPHTLQVPHAERGGAIVEPRLTTQWYCDAATLAKPAIEAVEQGRTVFVPRSWENTFFAWMRDIKPWCISRQLWWGHRIPAWYGPDGHVFVALDAAEAQAQARVHYGTETALEQDPDVLDTWFSSGLWPFSTLGWPRKTVEFERYYPTDVLVTGFDIIFFWVARMMMFGLHITGEVPFRTVCMHGLVRDEQGRKMSKSLGNGLDPITLIDEFGADALRFTICALTGPGRDIKLGPSRVKEYRSFVTKLWNAARFCEMNAVAPVPGFDPATATQPISHWILSETDRVIAEATAALEAFRFDEYAASLYRFTWNVFCDWLLELAKPLLAGEAGAAQDELRAVIAHVLGTLLRLMQPVMPFVTETLWESFGFGGSGTLAAADWPQPGLAPAGAAEAREEIDWLTRLIGELRALRTEMGVAPSVLAPLLLRDAAPRTLARAERWSEALRRMGRVSEIAVLGGALPKGAAQLVLDEATLVIPLEGIVDLEAERARLGKERARLVAEREKSQRKLDNPDFVARAKPEVVEENRDRVAGWSADIERLDAALSRLG
jgi:valyl-tRNA synthetase